MACLFFPSQSPVSNERLSGSFFFFQTFAFLLLLFFLYLFCLCVALFRISGHADTDRYGRLFLFHSCPDDAVTVHEPSTLLMFYPSVDMHDDALMIFCFFT